VRALLVLLLATWSGAALADCPAPYTGTGIASDLSVASTALREQNDAQFKAVAARLEAGLPCADTLLPRQAVASAARDIGVAHFRAGDEAGGKRWLRTALELDSTYSFDVDEMDFSDPLRTVYDEQRSAAGVAPTALQGKGLETPDGTAWYLDGRPLSAPSATLDRPHLLQRVSTADNKVLAAWIIDGNSFPAETLQSTVVAAATPSKTKKAKEKAAPAPQPAADPDAYQVVQVNRLRPPAKTPLMILGGVGVLGGGAVYALSFAAHKEFEAATTTDALLSAQKKTNLLVLASGGVLVLGLGVGYVGVTLDAGPGWMIGGRF